MAASLTVGAASNPGLRFYRFTYCIGIHVDQDLHTVADGWKAVHCINNTGVWDLCWCIVCMGSSWRQCIVCNLRWNTRQCWQTTYTAGQSTAHRQHVVKIAANTVCKYDFGTRTLSTRCQTFGPSYQTNLKHKPNVMAKEIGKPRKLLINAAKRLIFVYRKMLSRIWSDLLL